MFDDPTPGGDPVARLALARDLVAALARTTGARQIDHAPGPWEHAVDDHWRVALNPHARPVKTTRGANVPPYAIYVTYDGWPAGHLDARGGLIACGADVDARRFVAALQAAIDRLHADKPTGNPESKTEGRHNLTNTTNKEPTGLRRPWTGCELIALDGWVADHLTDAEIAQRLNRTPAAVTVRRQSRGVRLPTPKSIAWPYGKPREWGLLPPEQRSRHWPAGDATIAPR